MNKKNLLITSGIITLSLLNASTVQAENTPIEPHIEVNQTEKIQDTDVEDQSSLSTSVEKHTETQNGNQEETSSSQSEDDNPIQNDTTKKIPETTQENFNEIIEQLHNLLNEEQRGTLTEVLSKDNEVSLLFKEALIDHETLQFKLVTEKYNELLTILNGDAQEIIEIIELLKQLAEKEISLLEYDFSQFISTEEKKTADKIKSSNEEITEIENPEFENSKNKINEAEVVENKNIKGNIISEETDRISVFGTQIVNQILSADDLYKKVLDAYFVSDIWASSQEFKARFPNDSRIQEVIDYAANKTFEYAKKQHSNGNYEDTLIYYNWILEEDLVRNSLENEIKNYKAQAINKKYLTTADEYYKEYVNAYYVSDLWGLSQIFKNVFPSDSRVNGVVNDAAEKTLEYALKIHRNGDYATALIHYERIMSEELVKGAIQSQTKAYSEQAKRNENVTTADQYYNEFQNAYYVSELWTISQEFKDIFPNDSRLIEVINYAAEKSLEYAQKEHDNGKYDNALRYYNRILDEEFVNNNIKEKTSLLHQQASKRQSIVAAAIYYDQVQNTYFISDIWPIIDEFKVAYPDHELLQKAIDYATTKSLEYAQKVHKNGNYTNALTYYNRILEENLVRESLKNEITIYKEQAIANNPLQTADDYYNKIFNADFVSQQWLDAQEFKSSFPNDPRIGRAINHAATKSLEYAVKVHKNGNYEMVLIYYNRISEESLVVNNIKNEVIGYGLQARKNKPLITADQYYTQSMTHASASGRWENAQKLKEYFPNDARLTAAINHAGEKNMELAMKYHNNGQFNQAAIYYDRVSKEEFIDYSIRIKAESYYYLSSNKLHITNTIVQYTGSGITLEKMVNIQVDKSPQFSHNGGWRDATRNEVARYVNPDNSLPSNLTNLSYILSRVEITTPNLKVRTGPGITYNQIGMVSQGESYTILDEQNGWYKIGKENDSGWISGASNLVNRNTDALQYLVLSGSSGISLLDLNGELQNTGILKGHGSTFQKASREANINELYLIAHALLETGRGTSALANGILVNQINGKPVTPRIVYNMFGIGAFDSNPNKFGAERAYQLGWFTPEDAIIGGAKWIASSYINNPTYQQNTLYKMRWNPNAPGIHQYATDVAWAYKQTRTLSTFVLLAQKYDLILKFDIPLYN